MLGSPTLVKRMLANALTSATPDSLDQLTDLINVGNSLDTNLVTDDVVNTYLQDADQTVYADLSELYATPLNRVADVEMAFVADLSGAVDSGGSGGASAAIQVDSETEKLGPGDILMITDGYAEEEVEIERIVGTTIYLVSAPVGEYSPSYTRVIRVDYPPPIKFIASRIAAANIYDKYFAAQADKNESQYGKFLRELATQQLNNIIQGITVLDWQERKGHLTADPNLIKRYGVPKGWNENYPKIDPPGR